MSYEYEKTDGVEPGALSLPLNSELFSLEAGDPEIQDREAQVQAEEILRQADEMPVERLKTLESAQIANALRFGLAHSATGPGYRLFRRLRDVNHPILDEEGHFECLGARMAFALGRNDEALEIARRAVAKLRGTPRHQLFAEALLIEGQVHLGRSQLESAVESLNAAFHIYHWNIGNIEGSIRVSNLLALVHKRRGKWVIAEDVLERALSIAQEHGLTDARLRILSNLAVIRLKLGKTAESVAALNELSLTTPKALQAPEANATLTWAIIDRMRGRFIQSRRKIRKVLRWARRTGSARTEILCFEYLADIRQDEGYPLLAIKLLNTVFRMTRERFPNTDLVCEVQRRRAEVLSELGKRGHARRAGDHALLVAQHIGEPFEIAMAHRARGLVYLGFGDVASALRELSLCEDGLRELGEKFELGRTLFLKAGMHIQQGGFEAGSDKLDEARRIFTLMSLDFWVKKGNQGSLMRARRHPFRN